jgi:sialate O-acetylesterase
VRNLSYKNLILPSHLNIRHMKKFCFTTLSLLLLSCGLALGNIRLPSAISKDMVLQQQSKVTLWGWSDPGEKIYVTTSWDNKVDSTEATDGARWKIYINTQAAGGPYTITLRGNNTISLDNVLIGEVWICSGQSNMEWSSYQNLKQIIDELPNSNNGNIRLLQVAKTTSEYPQDDLPGQWKVCSPESLKGFSAIGYFFGKKLQHDLNVPIGLINASWGGTPAEVWTEAEIVNNAPVLKDAAHRLTPSKWWPVKPGIAYNAMIAPLTNFAIAGAIWYQGESNTGTAASYHELFTSMIGNWRKAWQKEFPFYYVQIAPFDYGADPVGALLREQQSKSLSFPNTGMVVITDLVDDIKDIHPKNKLDVAIRLANWALAETYKKDVGAYKSPVFKNIEINNGKASLFFDNAPNGFVTKNGKATDFYMAGEDRKFEPAEARIEKDRIIVSSKQVKKPVAVRFGFSNTATPNLFSKEGLPVTPFRTDNWETNTVK